MRICKYIAIITLFFLSFTLCSCTRVIKNPADEIRLNIWKCEFKDKSVFLLEFKEDDAVIKILKSNKKADLKISGKAFIDKKRIAVFDRDKENYIFDYELKGSVLRLKYGGGTIDLKRINKLTYSDN